MASVEQGDPSGGPGFKQDPSQQADQDKQYLVDVSHDFKRLQQQKSRRTGGVEGRILLNLAFVLGEHYTVYQNRQILAQALDPNKLSLVFNLIERRVNKLIGRLCSVGGTFKSVPDRRDPKAFSEAEVVDRMIKALDRKVDQPSRIREIFFWLLVGGVAFEFVPWVQNQSLEPMAQFNPDNPEELMFTVNDEKDENGEDIHLPQSEVEQQIAQGVPAEKFDVYEEVQEVGEVGSKIYSPLQVFIDQGVRSIKDLAPDQAVYIAEIKTQEWIKENFEDVDTTGLESDNDLQIVTTRFQQMENSAVAGVTLKDMIPIVQGSAGPDDPAMNVVVYRFQPAGKQYPHGRYTCFVPQQMILFDGDNPYEEIPIVDYHWKPVTINFWSKDYITDLIAPQRFLNKRMSQLGEQSNAAIYDKVLLGPNISEHDIPADWPGLIRNGVNEEGVPMVARLAGPQLPNWFMQSIDLTLKLMDDIAGGTDLTEQSQFPGQLRGPMAVPMIQEIIDTEWGPLYDHMGERLARAKQMRLNRVKQYYPALRTMHYMDRAQRDEVFEFHTDKILRSGTDFTISIERGSLMPELRALREARVRERLASPLSILYIDERTGKLDKSKIAEDLQFGDVGRESKEAQYRKLGAEIVGRIWRAEQVPPVLPFWNHAVMMDELEAAMASTEFLSTSPQVQQMFQERWQMHQQFLVVAAQQQQQTMENTMIHSAMMQAAQQTAAQTAAETAQNVKNLQEQAAAATAGPTAINTMNKVPQ